MQLEVKNNKFFRATVLNKKLSPEEFELKLNRLNCTETLVLKRSNSQVKVKFDFVKSFKQVKIVYKRVTYIGLLGKVLSKEKTLHIAFLKGRSSLFGIGLSVSTALTDLKMQLEGGCVRHLVDCFASDKTGQPQKIEWEQWYDAFLPVLKKVNQNDNQPCLIDRGGKHIVYLDNMQWFQIEEGEGLHV